MQHECRQNLGPHKLLHDNSRAWHLT